MNFFRKHIKGTKNSEIDSRLNTARNSRGSGISKVTVEPKDPPAAIPKKGVTTPFRKNMSRFRRADMSTQHIDGLASVILSYSDANEVVVDFGKFAEDCSIGSHIDCGENSSPVVYQIYSNVQKYCKHGKVISNDMSGFIDNEKYCKLCP